VEFRLLETKRKIDRRLFGTGFGTLAVHGGLVLAVVFGTMHAGSVDTTVRMDTTVVLLTQEQKQPEAPPPAVQIIEPLRGFQTVVVPSEIPTSIPSVDLQQHFDPKDYSGIGVEGGRADGVVPRGDAVYAEAVVEERPALLSAPPPPYPDLLKQSGIEGRVLLRAIVDTTGHAEPNSVEIISSPNPGFNVPARMWVLRAVFRPARLHGQAVRVHVTLPIDYSLRRG